MTAPMGSTVGLVALATLRAFLFRARTGRQSGLAHFQFTITLTRPCTP